MQIDRRRVELLQLQYELAMAIGVSLEMQAMLRHALSTFLRKLNCSAGSIFIRRDGQHAPTPECAIPRRHRGSHACCQAVEALIAHDTGSGKPSTAPKFPIQGGDPIAGYHHILELPNLGFIALERQNAPLDPLVVKSLSPLLIKLSSASLACLQNEELARTNRRIEFEHRILRTVIDNTPIIIFAVDRDGRFTLSEGHGLEALGRTPGEIVGQSIFDYYAETPQILDAVQKAMDGQANVATVDVRGLAFDAYYEPIYDHNRKIAGVVGVAHNITERKEAAETLATVLDTVGEGIITIDQNGIIVMANEEVQQIFGYNQKELLGANLQMLMPARHRATHHDGMERYLSTGEAKVLGKRLELEGLHRDGRVFPLDIRIQEAILREQHYFTASMRDITRRKEYDRMRDDFVSTVSHELRTPLSAIMGWTETLISERPGLLTPDQDRFLKIIYSSGERLQSLIEEILTVSRVQSGTLQLKQTPFLPSKVIESVHSAVTPLLDGKSITLKISDAWPRATALNGDGRRMEQVLTNLLGNAIKFSPEASAIQLVSTARDEGWYVEVRDQGIGIPEAELPHIFERFYRASTAKDTQIQGTGLGLYICKALIEEHDGSIGLTSKTGTGTTVWFWLPR